MSDYAQQNSKKSTQEIKDAYKRHEEGLKNNIDRETSRKQYVSDFNKIMSTGVSNAAKYSVNKLLDEYGSMTMTAFVDSATNIPSLTKYNGHRDSINYGRNLVNDYMVYSVLNTTRIGG